MPGNLLPALIENEDQLEEVLSTPSDALIEDMGKLKGDIMILGAGGKMGPSMAKLAMRASLAAGRKRQVYAVNRSFREQHLKSQMEAMGIKVIQCDFLDQQALEQLPDAENIVFLAGMKFGSSAEPSTLWTLNVFMPGLVARRFRHSRIVELSSGNIYGLNPVLHGGAVDNQELRPFGDYAQSVVGRDRMFEYAALEYQTKVTLLRLFYAIDMRYGVILDIGRKIMDNTPVDLSMGNLNCLWQGDANAQTLRSLLVADSPAVPLIITGPETVSLRWLAGRLGELLGKEPILEGVEASETLLGNSATASRIFGYPSVSLDQLIIWTAHWIKIGGPNLGKPTKFQIRDGKF